MPASRHELRALLTLALFVTGACRFDPSGLPAVVDAATDLPAVDGPVDDDADLTDTGPAPDLTVDAPIPPDTTKPCPTTCQGQTPICEPTSGTCRACASPAECPAGLCAADGSCPDASLIAHVDGSMCPTSQKTGTAAEPYCSIDEAVGQGKLYILVKQGTYAKDLILDNVTHEIYGEPGTVIQPSACDKLEIKGGSSVLLQGFSIAGNVLVSAGTATLAQNVIGPSSCVGVTSTATVTLRRNLVFQHTGGGMVLGGTYHVENNFIVQNGTTAINFGGVKLATATGELINNTVVDNTCQTKGPAEAGGVRCEVKPTTLVNNIFWGNTFNKTASALDDRQYRTDRCVSEYAFEELKPGASSTGTGNISAATPGFAGATPSTSAADYHLLSSSAARDSGTSGGAPVEDYDGDPRSDGQIDIGADEWSP